MKKSFQLLLLVFLLAMISVLCLTSEVMAQGQWISWKVFLMNTMIQDSASTACGEKVIAAGTYEKISLYSIYAGLALFFLGIFIDKKKIKLGLWGLCAIPILAWAYVNFMVDFNQIKQTVFNYNVQVESNLANLAEGQERYKSDNGHYIKDLDQLYSHVAGAHGMDRCVKILEMKTYLDYWTATAQHVSSPEKIYWDSRTGSSLKKG
ncbi:MAG: hypothetical protein ACE5EK_01090 [Nitrospinales bacterium]